MRFEQSFDEGDGRRSAVHAAALMRAALIVACEVLVENAMPLALRKTESVLWIFNTARLLSSVQDAEAPGRKLPCLNGRYYSRAAFSTKALSTKRKAKAGDLVLTNYSAFFVSSPDEHSRLSISRITGLRAHIDGVEIGFPKRLWTLYVSDPWFLANAVTLLSRRLRGPDSQNVPDAIQVMDQDAPFPRESQYQESRKNECGSQ